MEINLDQTCYSTQRPLLCIFRLAHSQSINRRSTKMSFEPPVPEIRPHQIYLPTLLKLIQDGNSNAIAKVHTLLIKDGDYSTHATIQSLGWKFELPNLGSIIIRIEATKDSTPERNTEYFLPYLQSSMRKFCCYNTNLTRKVFECLVEKCPNLTGLALTHSTGDGPSSEISPEEFLDKFLMKFQWLNNILLGTPFGRSEYIQSLISEKTAQHLLGMELESLMLDYSIQKYHIQAARLRNLRRLNLRLDPDTLGLLFESLDKDRLEELELFVTGPGYDVLEAVSQFTQLRSFKLLFNHNMSLSGDKLIALCKSNRLEILIIRAQPLEANVPNTLRARITGLEGKFNTLLSHLTDIRYLFFDPDIIPNDLLGILGSHCHQLELFRCWDPWPRMEMEMLLSHEEVLFPLLFSPLQVSGFVPPEDTQGFDSSNVDQIVKHATVQLFAKLLYHHFPVIQGHIFVRYGSPFDQAVARAFHEVVRASEKEKSPSE